MKKITNLKLVALTVLVFFISVSCDEDELLETVPKGQFTADALFQSEEGFQAGLNGLYALTRIERSGIQNGFNGDDSNELTATMTMGGTDIIFGNRPWNSERYINQWGDFLISGGTQDYFSKAFEWLYRTIATCNTLINRLESFDGLEPSVSNRMQGEARTIRAWAYRHLTFLFGDVPLSLEEIDASSVPLRFDWQRDPVAVVRAAMKEDLEFAVANLPETHTTNASIIRAVAQHYLTELLIIEGNYSEAIQTGLDAINGPRSLVTSRLSPDQPGTVFSDMFLDGNVNPGQGNTEVLWVHQNADFLTLDDPAGSNIMRRWFMSEYSSTAGGAPGLTVTVDRGGRGNTRLGATKFLFDLYRDTDGNVIDDRGDSFAWRLSFVLREHSAEPAGLPDDPLQPGQSFGDVIFTDATSVEVEDGPTARIRAFIRKWDSALEADPRFTRAPKDHIYLRLADTYLLLAEAYHLNGDNDNAAFYINALRARANAPLIAASDVTMDYILDERARELATEEHRRYTLLRTDKWVERTNLHNNVASGKIDPNRDRLYPIPQDFIDANIDNPIQNNPGY